MPMHICAAEAIALLHTRRAQPSSRSARPTDGPRDFDSQCTGIWLFRLLAEPTRAREVGARAKTSTAAAARALLYSLVIGMPYTRYRWPLCSQQPRHIRGAHIPKLVVPLYNMTCGAIPMCRVYLLCDVLYVQAAQMVRRCVRVSTAVCQPCESVCGARSRSSRWRFTTRIRSRKHALYLSLRDHLASSLSINPP